MPRSPHRAEPGTTTSIPAFHSTSARRVLGVALLGLLLVTCVSDEWFAPRPPAGHTAAGAVGGGTGDDPAPRDVIVILTDDQRFDQMQYMPLTSALLNAETVRFSRGFVTTSLCCPSRSSILTGLYVHNHGVKYTAPPEGGAISFDPASTVATWLHDAGYRTALIGKYLNGYSGISPAIPPGWDNFEALVSGGPYYNYSLNRNGTLVSYGATTAEYSTDVYAALASQFINTAPAEQPIFLYFAPSAPHTPATPHPQDAGSYASFPNWRPRSFNEANVSDKPTWIRNLQLISASKIATSDALHRSMLESLQSVDRAVASIIETLQQTGRWSNTLVVFLSDNGLTWGEHRLRDTKVCPYEECIRVPFWVRMPGVVARTDTNLVANIDLAPTLAAWAGVTPPVNVNGKDLLPLLQNPATAWRTELLIEHFGESFATSTPAKRSYGVRTSRYLYNEYDNGNRELYDLVTDPLQLTSVASKASNAALVASLKAKLSLLKLE
jgi:N-acetylglucosamine-6-sulfatase